MERCGSESRDGHVVETGICSRVMLTAGCSETFLLALHGDDYSATASTTTTTNSSNSSSNQCEPVNELHQDDDDDDNDENVVDVRLRQTAGRRAWNRLRVYVDERAARQRHNSTAMNWRFIRQTLDAMAQLQQSRALLYERYLQHPDDWLRGFINYPTHLMSQRRTPDTAAAATDVSRKPRTTTIKR